MKFSDQLEEIRARASEQNSNTNDYWSISKCQEDRRMLLHYIDKLLELHNNTREIMQNV